MQIKLDFSRISAILIPVSERNTKMKNENMIDRIDLHLGGLLSELNNEKKNKETFECENCNETHPIETKKEYGWRDVCPECELHLSDEFERIGKIAFEKVEKKLDFSGKV